MGFRLVFEWVGFRLFFCNKCKYRISDQQYEATQNDEFVLAVAKEWAKTLEWKKSEEVSKALHNEGPRKDAHGSGLSSCLYKIFPLDMPGNGRGAWILG